MKQPHRLRIICTSLGVSLMLLAGYAHANKVYKWVDENGITHYGDYVPPQYSEHGHSVLNQQGVELETVEGALTEEERQARALAAEEAERAQRALEASQLRDRVLLSTYLSVSEIEALRDRRIELVQAQIHVTEIYLDNLRSKLKKLETDAERYSPYNTSPDAPPIDEKLARELADTIDSIMLYEKTLKGSEAEQQRLTKKFSDDIDRFRELKAAAIER